MSAAPEITQVVTLPSRFDVHELDDFADTFAWVSRGRRRAVMIDARFVKHMDSAGLEALVDLGETAGARGVAVRLVPSITIQVLCELAGVELAFTRPVRDEVAA